MTDKEWTELHTLVLKPNQRVVYNDVYYILKDIDHKCNSSPLGMLWLCKEENPSIAVGVVNIFFKIPNFGDMSNLIHNVEDIDNLRILYRHHFPEKFEKKTFWQKLKELFA